MEAVILLYVRAPTAADRAILDFIALASQAKSSEVQDRQDYALAALVEACAVRLQQQLARLGKQTTEALTRNQFTI